MPRFPTVEETFSQLVWFVTDQNNGIVSKFVSTQIWLEGVNGPPGLPLAVSEVGLTPKFVPAVGNE